MIFSLQPSNYLILIINKTRFLLSIGCLQIWNLLPSNCTQIRFHCLHNLAINTFVFNKAGIIILFTSIFFCKYFYKHATPRDFSHYKYSIIIVFKLSFCNIFLTTLKLMTLYKYGTFLLLNIKISSRFVI